MVCARRQRFPANLPERRSEISDIWVSYSGDMRGLVLVAATAGALSLLAGASGNFMDCPNGPGVPLLAVPVRAMTPNLKIIEGLQAGDFGLTMDRVPQEVCGFNHSRWPVSIGILLDTSGSMRTYTSGATPTPRNGPISVCRAGIEHLLSLSGPQDEYFLEYASDKAAVRVGFTRDASRIRAGLGTTPKGRTALIDGIYQALNEMYKAQYPTRAIVVFSDGEDNRSAYTFAELAAAFSASPVPIFLLAPTDPTLRWRYPSPDEPARVRLVRFVEKSGGYAIEAPYENQMLAAAAEVASAIRLPYILYFAGPAAPVQRRALQVEVKGIRPRPRLFYGDALDVPQ